MIYFAKKVVSAEWKIGFIYIKKTKQDRTRRSKHTKLEFYRLLCVGDKLRLS